MSLRSRLLLPVAPLVLALFATCTAAAPRVVASIPPVHSLVAAVMRGVAEPELLIPPGASPHTYALRPSDAAALAEADAVFWVGPGLAAFLADPLAAIAGEARIVALHEVGGVRLLPYRTGLDWRGHVHGNHPELAGHEGHHDEHHGEAGHHEHGRHHRAGANDMHIWLDPNNARVMVDAIVETLSVVDPEHASAYAANGERARARIEAMDARLRELLAPVSERPYIVFHDAYQYFERHYDLSPVGAVTVSPDRRPGAGRLVEIRERIGTAGAACVFAEPQFNPGIVRTLTQGTGARRGILDPLGASLSPGVNLYFRLMGEMATAVRDCLAAVQ